MSTMAKNNFRVISTAGLFLFAYIPAIMVMWDRWFARDSYYSHGILIPFVTLFLIWQQRSELKMLSPEKSPWGLVLFTLGLMIYFASFLFRINFSAGFSMLIVFYGLVLHYYGPKVFLKVLFPVFFLVFMVPLPSQSIVNISFRMKLFAATIATDILNFMGLYARQEGSIIVMRHANVIVDDVCSGLRSLISLTALGSIFAYWFKGPMWKRVLIFLTTIPIAIITNVCRVILLSSVSEIWGPKYATGFFHDVTGFMVFGLAFVLLFCVGRLLE